VSEVGAEAWRIRPSRSSTASKRGRGDVTTNARLLEAADLPVGRDAVA
jgi:hypothetical protein